MTIRQPSRKFEMRKPEGHEPAIQRYSSRLTDETKSVQVVIFGAQFNAKMPEARSKFLSELRSLFGNAGNPLHYDIAKYTDPQSYENWFAVCYWHDQQDYKSWEVKLNNWLSKKQTQQMEYGVWFESFEVPLPYRETIAFKEYLRGLSACPHSKIEPMNESGYWGAARDRFEASAFDEFNKGQIKTLVHKKRADTFGKRITIENFPENLCVIRSGVSWEDCGAEQLQSYQKNLAPKLDAGMEYLRQNPVDTGCCSLRQVICADNDGNMQKEAYSLGFFLSYKHLEDWSHNHPTHLAIYTRALAERKKYQEKLELKTYHEIYILNQNCRFEYLNCHPETGLIPYFKMEKVAS